MPGTRQIRRARHCNSSLRRQRGGEQIAIVQHANADRDVDALIDEIDYLVADMKTDLNLRIAKQERCNGRRNVTTRAVT